MERVTLRVPKGQLDLLEEQVDEGKFSNRSAAVRAAIREFNDEYEDRKARQAGARDRDRERRKKRTWTKV